MMTDSKCKELDIECPEEHRIARLRVEWGSEEGRFFLRRIRCNHLGAKGTGRDNCNWSCIEGIIKDEAV